MTFASLYCWMVVALDIHGIVNQIDALLQYCHILLSALLNNNIIIIHNIITFHLKH